MSACFLLHLFPPSIEGIVEPCVCSSLPNSELGQRMLSDSLGEHFVLLEMQR